MIFFDLSVHIVHRPCRSEEIRMSDLVVIVSPAEAKAEEYERNYSICKSSIRSNCPRRSSRCSLLRPALARRAIL